MFEGAPTAREDKVEAGVRVEVEDVQSGDGKALKCDRRLCAGSEEEDEKVR